MNVYEKLHIVQSKLKCNKSQYNSFGKYSYRNCEDILESVKPILDEVKAIIIVSDDIVVIDGRFYVKATVTFIDIEGASGSVTSMISNTAYAREEESKKGMDASQVTGATSSYARKYALNGLLCIDDTKDADSMDNTGNNNDHKNTGKKKEEKHVCSSCSKEIKGFEWQGTKYTDDQAWDFAIKRGNGKPLCGSCAKKQVN